MTKKIISYIFVFLIGFLTAIGITSLFLGLNLQAFQQNLNLKPLATQNVLTASGHIVAVKINESGNYEGVIGEANVEIRPGKGRVLLNTNPFVETDTQQSMETAVNVAQQYSGVSLGDRDVIISFEIQGNVVGGPSAGAAMTAATIAALEGKQLRNDVIITGTIEEDGSIGQIGGVMEKATAAAQAGIKLFLVPQGQKNFVYYEPVSSKENRGAFTIIRTTYVPRTIDLDNYTFSEFGMHVQEVSNITEAVNLMVE